MSDEVGRKRLGRESVAHSSARAERAKNRVIPSTRTRKRSKLKEVSSTAENQPEGVPEVEFEIHSQPNIGENDVMDDEEDKELEKEEDQPEDEQEEEDTELDVEAEDDALEDEDEQPPPPSPPKRPNRRRKPKTTRHKVTPVEPPVGGFGGGPSDLSLLPQFGHHIAAYLCGLRPLLKTNYNNVDWGLLTAFTERWQPDTGTFHLPVGEMTITLDDVSCLLHIPISGKMLNHVGTACKVDEEHEKDPEDDIQFYRDCTIRCFLLYLLGATLFTNKSTQYVDVIFLTYLQDLNVVNTWNWGASGLAYLYHYLDKATKPNCGNNGGYNCLFQAWIMAHFKNFGMRLFDDNYNVGDPLAAKFVPLKGPPLPFEHRTTLDRMEVDEVTWQPYEDHRQSRPFQDCSWYSGWIMCGSAMICRHLPERVLRQYGHVQSIPRAPVVAAKVGMNRFTIDEAFQKMLVENYVTEEMRGPRAINGFEADPGYIAWFYRVSHPKIWPPIGGNPPRPANVEVIIEEDNANDKMDVFEICRNVRSEVKERLDSELTLEEAREALQKV
ncbi:protein MAIN-LIKE [Trifolium repens]|nr:protein MAIN-LIKE [Trifolium repens]